MITDNKKGYTSFSKMRELLRDNALLLPVLSRFDIAFGFGEGTVAEVCSRNNVDVDTFIAVCNLHSGYRVEKETISLHSLTGYLKRAHKSFLDVELPKIRRNMVEAIGSVDSDEVAALLIKFYDEYVEEVRRHMEYENDVIFSYIDKLLEGNASADFNIADYSESHCDTVAKLNELKEIFISHYSQKDNMRLSSTLLDIIICGRDMMSHFEVESKLLIPCVERLENELRLAPEAASESSQENGDLSGQLQTLSQREKDIIREVALGKANKEIADDLYISVHTVTTHRRNICAKLDIHTSAGLTVFAIIHHLVDISEVEPR